MITMIKQLHKFGIHGLDLYIVNKKKVQAAWVAAKKKENKKWADEGEGSSKPKSKRRKTHAIRKGQTASYGGTTSPLPIQKTSLAEHSLDAPLKLEEENADEPLHRSRPRSDPQNAPKADNNIVQVSSHEFVHNYIDVDAEQVFANDSNADNASRMVNNPGSSHGRFSVVLLSESREILRVEFCGGEVDEKKLVEMGEVGEGPFGEGEGGERGRKGTAMAGVDRDRDAKKEEIGRIS
ncbi:hypothetical protein Tco_1004714 [Tanacetum coccineum]|uniref:Uncharacterized protein n=1 Tax=Tanacetum coccineum TaxID=301880 RepID=A0ABQ5FD29_9ASTR